MPAALPEAKISAASPPSIAVSSRSWVGLQSRM
jgi:hypothetical protein